MANNNVVITITGVNNTGPAFNGVRNSAQSAANAIEKSFSTIGNSFKSVGKSMTAAITLPVAGIVGSSVKTAMNFEQQMSKVQAVSFATAEEMQELTATAKEVGRTTSFSATEAAQALEYMAQAGWKTKSMVEGIDGVVKLANAGGLDVARASEIATAGINAFGMNAGELGKLADVLSAGANAAMTDVSGMGESFSYAAPMAGTLKMSIEDTTIALGLMANMGIDGSRAGTALKTSLANLSNPTKKMKGMMDSLGISLVDNKNQTKSLKTVMDELRYNFNGLTETQKAQAAATMFGKEAMAGMLAIINASEHDYNLLTSAVYSATDGVGVGAKMQEIMLNNLSGQVKILKSAWESIQLKIADSVIPTIKQFVSWVQKVADKVNEMKPETLDMIVKFALIAATVGPVIWMFGSFITSVLAIIKGITAFAGAVKMLTTTFTLLKIAMIGASSTPWGLIISAIGAAIVGLCYVIYKNWDKIKSCLSSAYNWVKDKWNELIGWLAPQVQGIAQKLGIEKELSVLANILKDFKWWDYFLPTGHIKLFDGLLKHFNNGNGIVEMAKNIGKKIRIELFSFPKSDKLNDFYTRK